MFEKILQKNEEVINYVYIFTKIFIILISSFISFSIWIDQSRAEQYLEVTILFSFIFFVIELIFLKNLFYKKELIEVFTKDYYKFFLTLFIIILIAALYKITSNYSRIWLVLFCFLSLIGIFFNKLIFNYFYKKIIDSNILRKNILIIGNFDDTKKLIKKLSNDSRFHFRACCFIGKNIDAKFFPIQQINLDKNLIHNIDYFQISQIWILAAENIDRKKIMNKINTIPIDIRTIYETDSHNDHHMDNISGYSIYDTSLSPFYGFNYLSKLLIDYFLGTIFLLISLPILILFALLILIEDGRPIFFQQKRHGWDGREINILKLRSLKISKHTSQVDKDDKRLLKIGKIIRRFSIDELPQFINVLKGQMSIVGPRPHALKHNQEFSKQLSGFMLRHKCKPGLTGLAQINGYRGNIDDKEKLLKRYEYDMLYIKKWSIYLDIKIIFLTSIKFLFQEAH